MFEKFKQHRLQFITVIFWLWLLYIVAAMVWWFISLEMQNHQMYEFRKAELHKDDALYIDKLYALDDAKHRKSFQYLGEGIVSIAFILFGAVFLYHHTRKQFRFAQQQQNFMMAITHELKTPIAVAQLNLETIQKRKLSEEMQQKLIANTLLEISRLHSLTNNILVSTQLESGNYHIAHEPVNLSKIIIDTTKDFRRRFISRDIKHLVEENIFVLGDSLSLQLVMSNLIDNAIKYSGKDTSIFIKMKRKNNDFAEISVADNGQGISEEEKTLIFNKFYRTGNEEVRKTKGTGLGLYLCKKIVKDLKGSISLIDNEPKGSIFIVNLPLIKNKN